MVALLAGCTSVLPESGDGSSSDAAAEATPSAAPAVATPSESTETPLQAPLPPACLDGDADEFGPNCPRGNDCDDSNAAITDQCYRCETPNTGCACSEDGAIESCNVATDGRSVASDGVCHSGTRLCTGGRWQRCLPNAFSTRTIVSPTTCGSACSPECRVTSICPTTPAELAGRGTGVIISNQPVPGFCPGGGNGGIQLPGGAPPPPVCVVPTCGGSCCVAGETCYTYQETPAYDPAICTGPGMSAPPPIRWSACGATCTAGQTHCGQAPADSCCAASEQCINSRCVPRIAACVRHSDCPAGYYCDTTVSQCLPNSSGRCNCERDLQQQSCIGAIRSTGGRVVNDIFRTRTGGDARTLRMARYIGGIESNPTGCPVGRINYQAGGPYACTTCTPTICDAWACFGGPRTVANIGTFADNLDWLFTQHVRLNPSGGGVSDGQPLPGQNLRDWGYDPVEGRKYDLGAPANRVVLFPITDHTSDSCLEPFEYTVWLSDNPNATTIASPTAPNPSQWNLAVLTETFTQGWTRNPNSQGNPADVSDLNTTAFGDAVADAMTTVWSLPCGYSFRYASIVAGNSGNPTAACRFHSFDDELDAIAGLTVNGDALQIYHELPFGTGAGPDGLNFSTVLRTADVYFLFDTTGSMGGELTNLRSAMTTGTFIPGCPGGVIGAIKCVIPDSWFGVGRHDDMPVSPYGSSGSGDVAYQNLLDLGDNPAAAQTAVNTLGLHYGNDWPESQTVALWATVTGRGLQGYFGTRTGCPAGRFGYPCFRNGSIPIVMLFTDAAFHNGVGNTNAYANNVLFAGGSNTGTLGTQRTPRFDEMIDEMNDRGVKVITVESSGRYAPAMADFNALAAGTGSLVGGGANAVYSINANGTGLGPAVVQAVVDLANYARMDVTARAEDNPATPVDERCFVRSPVGAAIGTIRLSNPAAGEVAPYAAGRCVDPPTAIGGQPVVARQCLPGTQVNFRADFLNNCVTATAVQQVFTFEIVVRGNGSYELGRVPVTIVVPPSAFPPSGTFTYDVDANVVCGAGRQPLWNQIQFAADTPAGTSIEVDAYTALTPAGLAAAPAVRVGVAPPATSPMDLRSALTIAGQPTRNPHLRVRFTLNSNAARSATPVLRGYRVLFDCIDGT